MIIQAKLIAMAETEVLSLIPASEYQRIKAIDENPEFRVYVIAHEGEAKPQIVGVGSFISKWFEKAVQKVHDVLKLGTKFFHHHEASNNTDQGRVELGEVIGKAVKIIKGKLSALAVAYIKPAFRNLKLDAASIEADVDLSDSNIEENVFNVDVKRITGVALADSEEETPAFTGATLLTTMQAFLNKTHFQNGGAMKSIAEIRSAIAEVGAKPSDVFSLGALTADSLIESHIETIKKEAVKGEYLHRKRDEEGFDKTREKMEKDHQKKLDDMQKQLDEKDKIIQKGQVGNLLKSIIKERKLDEKQQKFIEKYKDKFEPEDGGDKLEKELNSWMDGKLTEFDEIQKDVLGIKDKPKPKPGSETKESTDEDEQLDEMSLTKEDAETD